MAEIVYTNGDTLEVPGTPAEVTDRLAAAGGDAFSPVELRDESSGATFHVNAAQVREVREAGAEPSRDAIFI